MLCNGGNTGTATVSAPGYTSYQWDAAAGNQITNPATNLAAGSYTVTVTDANTCTGSVALVVTEPSPLTASEVHVDPSCNGFADGTATATGANGTPGLPFLFKTHRQLQDLLLEHTPAQLQIIIIVQQQ